MSILINKAAFNTSKINYTLVFLVGSPIINGKLVFIGKVKAVLVIVH